MRRRPTHPAAAEYFKALTQAINDAQLYGNGFIRLQRFEGGIITIEPVPPHRVLYRSDDADEPITSMDEFEKKFFPRQRYERILRTGTPKEIAEMITNEILTEIFGEGWDDEETVRTS